MLDSPKGRQELADELDYREDTISNTLSDLSRCDLIYKERVVKNTLFRFWNTSMMTTSMQAFQNQLSDGGSVMQLHHPVSNGWNKSMRSNRQLMGRLCSQRERSRCHSTNCCAIVTESAGFISSVRLGELRMVVPIAVAAVSTATKSHTR